MRLHLGDDVRHAVRIQIGNDEIGDLHPILDIIEDLRIVFVENIRLHRRHRGLKILRLGERAR